MELDARDATHTLSDRDWERRRQDLEKRGGPPSQIHHSIAAMPEDGALHARRGRARAELGQWAEAEADADFAKAASTHHPSCQRK
jgi:hypothetical protein